MVVYEQHPVIGQSHDIFRCVSHGSLEDYVFGDAYVISLGFLVVLAVTIPIGFFNLDENIWVQVRGCSGAPVPQCSCACVCLLCMLR